MLDSTELPLGLISKMEKTTTDSISICSKDCRKLEFSFDAPQSWIEGLYSMLYRLIFSKDQTRCFAFSHKLITSNDTVNGWNLYDPLAEYDRIGITSSHSFLRISNINMTFDLSDTYPRFMIFPKGFSDSEVKEVANYRSRNRIPVVVWMHPNTKATLSRCAQVFHVHFIEVYFQPSTGIQGKRCPEDEKLLSLLRGCNPTNSEVLHIMDARPFKAAVGNSIMGKGYENTDNYEHCKIMFLDIGMYLNILVQNLENIHAIRSAQETLAVVLDSGSIPKPDSSHIVPIDPVASNSSVSSVGAGALSQACVIIFFLLIL